MSEKSSIGAESDKGATRRFGPFEIHRVLGTGGMGIVYLATYLKTGQDVALKILSPTFSANEQLLKRFEREMDILKRLKHEHVVLYLGGGRIGSQHFYAMELMGGGSLETILKEKGSLSWEQTIDYARQIAKALEHSHNHGIVHRDLKPANCFLSDDGTLKLGDFGIARDTQATALTVAGKTVGTYGYMAPEQISGKPGISRKTDLYALGCVMFEMLAGRTPFTAETPAEMLFQHLNELPPPVTAFAIDCPPPLEAVIEKLLEKDPENRYYDALALQMALDQAGVEIARLTAKIAKQTVRGGTTKVATQQDKELIRTLLGKKKKKRKKSRYVPIYERTWVLLTALLLLISVVTWAMWPISDAKRFARAEALMEQGRIEIEETGVTDKWISARQDLEILVADSEGEFAARAQEYLDEIETEKTERQVMNRYNRQRSPESDAEGQLFRAIKYEDFGDRVSAIERYDALIRHYEKSEPDRAIVNVARRRQAALSAQAAGPDDRVERVRKELDRAEQLIADDQQFQARETWKQIIALYADNREFDPLVNKARTRLKQTEPPTIAPAPTDPPNATKESSDDSKKPPPEASTPPEPDVGPIKGE